MNAETAPVIVVAGLGRCGSTLTMNMLAAGGVPCHGSAPAYEDTSLESGIHPAAFEDWSGKAVKILDPQRVWPPYIDDPVRIIWVQRRLSEQARSIGKMLNLLESIPPPRRKQLRRIEQGLLADTREARARLSGYPMLTVHFEMTLAHPEEIADSIAHFLRPMDLDTAAMASVVRKRSPLCAPDLSMELQLLKEADHG